MKIWILHSILVLLLALFVFPTNHSMMPINSTGISAEFEDEEESKNETENESEKEADTEVEKVKHHFQNTFHKLNNSDNRNLSETNHLFFLNYCLEINLPPPQKIC